jgi:zinc/manganese transport system substrate-binding protein
MKKLIYACLLVCAFSVPALAKTQIVATLPWIGSLAGELGRERVQIKVLVKPSQDPHHIEAKPSMILAARNADILMYNGLDLETGYLPRIIESSANPAIQPGRPGNLDCSRFIEVIEKHATADRSLGDVHPLGNPHYHLSAQNILKIARGMTRTLSALDRGQAEFYQANLAAFESMVKEWTKKWAGVNLKGKRYVAYHRFFEYLPQERGFQIVAYIEEKPGIPPSARHMEKLIESMRASRPDRILTTVYNGGKDSDSLSRKTGIKAVKVPHDVGSVPAARDWFSLMDAVMTSLQ